MLLFEECFEYAKEFFSEIKKRTPDIILLDLMLPDMDGMEILCELRGSAATKNTPVIILSAKGDRLDKIKGLDNGADDYITKPFDILELIARIKAVLRRTSSLSETNDIYCGDIRINTLSHKVYSKNQEILLTYKEYELLKLLITNKDVVMTRSTLMDKIWGFSFEGETRTVDVHIRTLRHKLGDSKKYIETVRNVGYRVTENV